jgi:hypothetical protein
MCKDLTSKLPTNFEFIDETEIWWSYVRKRVEGILQFDHNWLTDTQRSAEVMAQLAHPVLHVSRGYLPEPDENSYYGPGLTWWGCLLPVHVDIVKPKSSAYGMLRAGVLLGNLGENMDPDLFRWLNNVGKKTPASTLLVSPTNDLWLCHSSAIDGSMVEEASVRLAGILHRLAAHGVVICSELFVSGELQRVDQKHPCSGTDVETNYFVSVLFEEGIDSIWTIEDDSFSPDGAQLLPFYKKGVADMLSLQIDLPIHVESDDQWGTILVDEYNPGKEYAYRCHTDVPANFQFEALRNDPRVWLYIKHLSQIPHMYTDKQTTLKSVNKRLWEGWVTGMTTILGSPEITYIEGDNLVDDTYLVAAVTAIWPAASLELVEESTENLTEMLSKLFMQMHSQVSWINN